MKKGKYIFLGIYIISISLICLFSLQISSTSSKSSGGISVFLINIIETICFHKVEIDFNAFHDLIRKLVGHFGLNLFSGVFGILTYYFFLKNNKKAIILSLTTGLIVAVVGELLQLTSEGRSCEVMDMVINFSGAITGIIVTFLIIVMVNKKAKLKI